MKKILIIASVAAIAMTSCTKEADPASTPANAVEFRTVFDKTKAAATDNTNLLNFNVNASVNTATTYDFMKDVTVTRRGVAADGTGGAWGFSSVRYWPSTTGTKVYFSAYSPADSPYVSGSAVSATGVTTYTYTAPTTASTTEDFIVAHNLITTTSATPGAVNLNFKHALSMVSFKAQNNSPGATFVIEKIELVGLGSKATLTNTPTATPGTAAFVWSTPTIPATFTASFAKTGFAGFVLEPLVTPSYKLLTTENEYLTVIPQTTPATGSVVRVTYHAYDGAGFTFIPVNSTKDFTLASQPFAAGSHYQFGFKFTAGNAISFTADVLPWVGPTGVDL